MSAPSPSHYSSARGCTGKLRVGPCLTTAQVRDAAFCPLGSEHCPATESGDREKKRSCSIFHHLPTYLESTEIRYKGNSISPAADPALHPRALPGVDFFLYLSKFIPSVFSCLSSHLLSSKIHLPSSAISVIDTVKGFLFMAVQHSDASTDESPHQFNADPLWILCP